MCDLDFPLAFIKRKQKIYHKKTIYISLFLLVLSALSLSAQELDPNQKIDLPPNPKAGKCYSRCFTYDTPFKWKEIDCKKAQNLDINCKNFNPNQNERENFFTYQKELQSKGYDVDVNGLLDAKTIKAHNHYIKQKKKEPRRQKRKAKKAKQK